MYIHIGISNHIPPKARFILRKIAATCVATGFATGETPVARCRNGSSQKLVDFSAFDLANNGISREVRFSVYHARVRTVLSYGCQGDGAEMGTAERTVCREQVWKWGSSFVFVPRVSKRVFSHAKVFPLLSFVICFVF